MTRHASLSCAVACFLAGILWMRRDPAAPTPPSPRAPAASRPRPPALSQPGPRVALPAGLPTQGVGSPAASPVRTGRTSEAWEVLLRGLADPGYEEAHPGGLAKMARILAAHPEDEEWEAGAVGYLARDLPTEGRTGLWMRAAEALPGNPAVADALIRSALRTVQDAGSLDALLAEQASRTPKDPSLAWLRASLAFEAGRDEDAEALLKGAPDAPWKERTGVAERGALRVQEALDGPIGPCRTIETVCGFEIPSLGRYQAAMQGALRLGENLAIRGETQRSLALLDAAGRMGRGLEDGSRMLVTYLTGLSVERRALGASETPALLCGDLRRPGAITARLSEVDAERKTLGSFIRRDWDEEASMRPILQKLGVLTRQDPDGRLGWGPFEILRAIGDEKLGVLLAPDEREALKRGFQRYADGEMARYRAWRTEPLR